MKTSLLVLGLAGLLAGCSVYMEATRPTPVDLTEYQAGTTRDYVIGKVGAPENSATQSDGASCDAYQMYTHGYGAGGKIPIAIAEGAADFFTLGLAEVVLTPTQGVTRNEKHPVLFCYKDQKLVRLTESGNPVFESAEVPATTAQASASPAASPSPGAEVSGVAPVASPAPASSPAAAPSPASAIIPIEAVSPLPPSQNPPAPQAQPATSQAAAPLPPLPPSANDQPRPAPVANPNVGDQSAPNDHPQ